MTSKAPGRLHRGDGGLAPQKIDCEVDVTLRGLLEGFDEIGSFVHRDNGIRTTLAQRGQTLTRTARGNNAPGAKDPRSLDRDATAGAGGPEDQHRFTRLELAAPGQRKPSRKTRIAKRRRNDVVNTIRKIEQPIAGHERPLRHGPIRSNRRIEEDPPAILEPPNPIGSDTRRQRRRSRVVLPGRLEDVEMMQSRRPNEHLHGVVTAAGILELLDSWLRSVLVEDGSTQGRDSRPSARPAQTPRGTARRWVVARRWFSR